MQNNDLLQENLVVKAHEVIPEIGCSNMNVRLRIESLSDVLHQRRRFVKVLCRPEKASNHPCRDATVNKPECNFFFPVLKKGYVNWSNNSS